MRGPRHLHQVSTPTQCPTPSRSVRGGATGKTDNSRWPTKAPAEGGQGESNNRGITDLLAPQQQPMEAPHFAHCDAVGYVPFRMVCEYRLKTCLASTNIPRTPALAQRARGRRTSHQGRNYDRCTRVRQGPQGSLGPLRLVRCLYEVRRIFPLRALQS